MSTFLVSEYLVAVGDTRTNTQTGAKPLGVPTAAAVVTWLPLLRQAGATAATTVTALGFSFWVI